MEPLSLQPTLIDFEATEATEVTDYEVNTPSLQSAQKFATENNLDIRYPGPMELFLDLDTPEQRAQFELMLPFFEKLYPIDKIQYRNSKGGNTHVILCLKEDNFASGIYRELDNKTRIAMQALLGSDPKRELFSIFRALRSDKYATLFFEVPPTFVDKNGKA